MTAFIENYPIGSVGLVLMLALLIVQFLGPRRRRP
jgi:hypothetical protein